MVTTSVGLVPIEDVKVGDLVLSHRSRWCPVVRSDRVGYGGEVVQVKPAGMRALVATPECQVWACKPKQLIGRTWSRLIPDGAWGFVPAGDVRAGRKMAGDFVFSPVPQSWPDVAPTRIDMAPFISTRKQSWGGRWYVGDDTLNWANQFTMPRWIEVDEAAAVLFGLYVAEGNVGGDHQVNFSLHEDERAIHAFVAEQALRMFGATASMDRRLSNKGVVVRINSSLASRFFKAFGAQCHVKQIPWSWMGWPQGLLLAIVRGWLLGDGTMSPKSNDRRGVCGVTTSPQWVEQVGMVLRSSEIPFSVCPFKQVGLFQGKPCGKRSAWMIGLTASDTARLVRDGLPMERVRWGEPDLSAIRPRTNARSMPIEGGTAVRPASIRRFQYTGDVCNLQVESDASYVVQGIVVHD